MSDLSTHLNKLHDQYVVKYCYWGCITIDEQYTCHAIVMEKGNDNLSKCLPQLTNIWNRLDVIEQIAKALDAIHDLGYIHGDLKLENVVDFAKKNWKVKLIDLDHMAKINMPMIPHCTFDYCPPEMAQYILNTTTKLDASTKHDVWCLGVLILKLCSGSNSLPDFVNLSDEQILTKIANESTLFHDTIDSLRGLNTSQQAVLKHCLHRDPTQRATISKVLQMMRLHNTNDYHNQMTP